MRLSKFALIAAAGLAAVSLNAAITKNGNPFAGTTETNLQSTDLYVLGTAGDTLTVNVSGTGGGGHGAVTYRGSFGGLGSVVKTGDATLQIDSWGDTLTSNNGYYRGETWTQTGGSGIPYTIGTDLPNGVTVPRNATGGLTVQNGTVSVSGYLQQWYDDATIHPPSGVSRFVGFSSIDLQGSSLLSFGASRVNVVRRFPILDGQSDLPLPGGDGFRLNFANNLSGSANTQLLVGLDDYSVLISQTVNSRTNGVGVLQGKGMFIVGGAGEFRVQNTAQFTGDVQLGSGKLSLVAATGDSLASAESVNLGQGGRSLLMSPLQGSVSGVTEYRPAYAPSAGQLGSAPIVLRVENGEQVIHNLQKRYGDAVATDAAGAVSDEMLYSFNIGASANIEFATTSDALRVIQNFDSIYGGTMSGGGTFIKEGDAALALTGTSSTVGLFDIRSGKIISNVQMLGTGTVQIASGAALEFVQNDAGTLSAKLIGLANSTVRFGTDSSITDYKGRTGSIATLSGKVDALGKPTIGTIAIAQAQDAFQGDVVAADGITIIFSASSGNAFANASSLSLLVGTGGEATTLTFNDTNQSFNNFKGDAGTRIGLGKGTITLNQNAFDTTYSGEIFGTGSLIKDGTSAFVINARNSIGETATTYSGATIVKNGQLGLGGANQIANSSALILAGGDVAVTGDQRVGALYGSSSSMLDMGSGTLTVGISAARRATMLNEVTTGGYLGAGFYLPTDDAGIPGYDRAATLDYLRNTAGLTGTDDEVLSFAGSITGTGGLIKVGTETLTLTGVNTYTGATQILGGKLRADYDALSGTSGVAISAGTSLEINAALNEVGTFSGALSGAGDFIKVGLGEVTLAGDTTAYTGTLTVAEGLLRFNAEGTSPGTVVVNSGATLALNTPTAGLTTTYTAGITSSGTIQKEGAGTLKLTNLTSLAGSGFNVLGGTLAVGNLGTGSGDINIAAGSTFETVTSSATTFSGQISGAGTFRVSGASSLTLDGTPPYPFTGIVEVAEAAVLVMQPGKNNLLTSASIVLKDDAVLDLSGTTQTFTGLTSDSANAQVNLSNGVLNFNVATGVTTAFSGNLVGPGTVNKSGDGTLSLQADIPVGLAGARIFNVAAGTLEATSNAVDNSTVNVQSGATFSLYNNVAGDANFTDYSTTTITLASGATLAKSGVGVVKIDDFGGVAGALAHVQAGTLFVVNPGNFPGAVFTGVVVDAGATYKLNVTGSSFTNDGSTANHITGAGSLAADGAGTLVLAGQQLYTGNTVLSNGATLQLDATASVSGITGLAMNGLAGTAGTSVSIPGATDLTINQLVDGEFDGTFVGGNNITVTGTAVLKLANTATSTVAGALIVDGGKLEVFATNTKAIDLTNAGELRIEVTGVNETYAGTINATGTGNKLVKTGTGTLDLAGTLAQVTGFSGSVGVAEGTLVLDPSSLAGLNGTITGLTTEGAGTLVLDVAANQQMPVVAVTGDGALEKSGAGTLFVNGGQLSGFTGLFTVSQGTLGGNFTTGGDLTIASGAKLAPGNSPGTIVVGGNFNLNSGSTLEVEINATTSDKVVVTGSATLAGALVVKQDSTPNSTKSAPGTSYSILTAAGGVTGTFSNEVNGVVQLAAADIVATGISRVRLTHTTNEITMTTVGAVSLIGGLHDGLGGLVAALDAGTLPPAVLAAVDSAVIGGNAAPVVNNLSPLGYAAEYAMAQDADNRLHAGLHDRLEQRRYDRASTLTLDEAPWEAFASATGSFADNKQATDTPTFNYRTFGGFVGLDKKVSDDLTVGAAVAYDNGSADLHDNGGKIEMSRATLTVFGGTQITSRWYVDGGLTGGYGQFDGKRRTALGSLKGSNDGLSVGGFVETGTIFAVTKDFHITPYLGAAYTHHEFDGVTESGNASALKTESWSNDSLRVKVGSGFGWFIPMEDWKLKLGLDAAFAHELIDTDSEIEASFASGGSKFSTTAAALPQDSVGLTPSIGVEFDETLSASIGYSYEMGFDGRSYQSVNFSVRKRF